MTRFKQFIQHWWRLLVIILILGALLYTWRLWLPVLQAWLLSTKDTLGSWADPMTTVLGIFAILGILWAIFKWALPSTQAIAVAPNNQNPPTSSILITPETIEQLLAKRLDAAVDLDANSKAYLTALVDLHRRLPMTGMGVNNLAVEFELLDLYVPLKASVSTPEGETWSRSMRLAGRLMSADEVETIGERQSDPVSLVQLLRDHAGVIILGDPGSGKSTFMKMLALRAALNQQAELGIGERIPFLLPLSEFANAMEKQDTSLSQCIGDFWRSRSPNLRVDALLDDALAKGKALVLLDGLDEVRQPALRKRVVDLTTHFFAHHQQKGNKFVLTSRIVGYREVRPSTVGLQECTIVDFGKEEIGQFVSQWTTAVANLVRKTATLSTWDAERERSGMMQTVERNAGVRQLASNPLLLTILALMKRSGIELPERRADLYETYIKTLLKSWNMARSLGKPLTSDLDEVETLRRLSPLALWMHEVSPGVGVVEEEAMKRKLSEICAERGDADPEKASLRLLQDVHVQSSLLLERGHRQYGFSTPPFRNIWQHGRWRNRGRKIAQPSSKHSQPISTTPTGVR